MSLTALRDRLKAADSAGGGFMADPPGMEQVVWHVPQDLTVKVESGVKLLDLQKLLADAGQWLPLDPFDPGATLKQIIDENLYGPRRYGFGTIREHLIGMEMLLADGRLVSSGGNVVKNVAGYDLMKLFVGARQSLGVVVSATFKLWPRPRREVLLRRDCADVAEAEDVTARLLGSTVCPVVLDWHGAERLVVTVAFAGEAADVQWQREQVAHLDFTEVGDLGHDAGFFAACKERPGRRSVLPSRLREAIEDLNGAPFVARAGNGTIWSEAINPSAARRCFGLEGRLKKLLDPRGLLPPIP